MKIILCGPPHSGKSVLLSNLIARTPDNSRTTIRACPDGEGTWSNNPNQEETSIVRKKGKFTMSSVDSDCQEIDRQINKIVFVDVGGIRSKENEKIFRHCDCFIVISNDEKEKEEWLKFGEDLGLECIGLFDSKLEGEEEIYEREPYLQGRIVGLERGKILKDSKVLNGIASVIIRKSGYIYSESINLDNEYSTLIDDTELGFSLGYGKEIKIDDVTSIKKVMWPESAISDINNYIIKNVDKTKGVKINGIKANFIIAAICCAVKKLGINNLETFDVRLQKFIPIRNIAQQKGIHNSSGLEYNLIENEEKVFMDVDITKERYELEDLEECVLPHIEKEKKLYLSGRMPHWLLASICYSYDINSIYTFQPGKGFVCVSSKDENNLGKVEERIEGIDTGKYFDDKKKRKANNYSAMSLKKDEEVK